ncbi:MAG: PqqD family peptide modification chaperone [Actinomycetia bacterium]|nr:PqqD family peptide modification chaperone [Actinomycetes bacterium]
MTHIPMGPYRALGLDFVVDVDPDAEVDTARTLTTVPLAPAGVEPAVRFSITREADHWILRQGEKEVVRSTDGQELIQRSLVTRITRRSLDHTPELLHIHGGTVVHQGRGLMVYGPSFAGKSTMVGSLVQAGCTFLSDESAGIEPATARVQCWPKPLSLRSGALELLGLIEPGDEQSGARVPLQYPATDLGSGGVVTEAEVALVIEVAFEAESDTVLEEIHPADAVVHLASNTLDLPRYGRGGMALMGRLAARARCARLTHSMAPATATQYVMGLVGDGVREPVPVEQLPRSSARQGGESAHAIGPDSRPQANRNIDAALIGNRVVIHDLKTRQVAALDEEGSLIWLHLDGEKSLAEVAGLFDAGEVRAGVLEFVRELAEEGLLI